MHRAPPHPRCKTSVDARESLSLGAFSHTALMVLVRSMKARCVGEMHGEMLVSTLPLPWHSRPCGDVKVFGTAKMS